MLSIDLQCDTLGEGGSSAADDVSDGPAQACSYFAAGSAATGAVSTGNTGDSLGAALPDEEAWHLQAARAAARRAGRRTIGPADGCYGCGPHRRMGRHAEGQRKMAAAVLRHGRVLVERPQTAAGRSPLWVMPRSEAALVVADT